MKIKLNADLMINFIEIPIFVLNTLLFICIVSDFKFLRNFCGSGRWMTEYNDFRMACHNSKKPCLDT